MQSILLEKNYLGKGFYFLDLTSFIKNNDKNNDSISENELSIYKSSFESRIKIKYKLSTNSLIVYTINKSYNQDSSTSKSKFSHLEFDPDNHNNFNIFYAFSNNSNKLADLNSNKIHKLSDFIGYAKISIINKKIVSFSYVSDFINRFSFGNYVLEEE
ncbi:hypothetical protein [Spiroplasma syrphidicola]|uniref:hypothetical protein n=1 Tax=Spiroplasma syrphidicola TaxID=216945 RepID=UPI00146152C7|nr:hypothetical protein [Spiroplasma syrphidicola]